MNDFRLLYGTTPPRSQTSTPDVAAAADKLASRLRALPLDGIVVYDIQDETGRTHLPRPFPFVRTVDPRRYSRMLAERFDRELITYKALGDIDGAGWNAWLDESAHAYGTRVLTVVGRPTSGVRYPMTLSHAIRAAVAHPAGFTVGGVTIAERHSRQRSESTRLLAKAADGCSFFVSQTVYDALPTVRLLTDYLRDCGDAGVDPRPIVLTFAPCGREKTLAFIRWLGVQVSRATERAIFGAADPLAASIEICRENLRTILEQPYRDRVRLGINVESVSNVREEIDASIDLFHVLKATLDGN